MHSFKKVLQTTISLFAIATIVAGCSGNINYSGPGTFQPPSVAGNLIVGVIDKRPYIISGSKPSKFVGLVRNGYGIPMNVYTRSGKPFAEEFASYISSTFLKNGVDAKAISLGSSSHVKDFASQLNSSSWGLLLEVSEWKSDELWNLELEYDARLKVIAPNQQVVAETVAKGEKKGDEDAINSLIAQALNELLEDRKIVSALSRKPAGAKAKVRAESSSPATSKVAVSRAETAETSKTAGSCSVQQILDMKKLGLTEEQIKGACPG